MQGKDTSRESAQERGGLQDGMGRQQLRFSISVLPKAEYEFALCVLLVWRNSKINK